MKAYKLTVLVLALLLITMLSACGQGAAPAAEAPAPAAAEAEAPAAMETTGDEVKKFGLVLHFRSPFTEQIAQGARDAAKEFGYEVEVVGPSGFDAATQIGMFEALVQKEVDGLAVIAYPAETWKEPIDRAVDAGIPVLTLNVHSAESEAAAWFGQDEYGSGEVLAEATLKYLEGKSGDIVMGVCAPGVNVLTDRVNGFREVMAAHPEFNLLGEFDVGIEAAENYAAWQNQLSAHPEAIAMVGFCSVDMPNLSKLREKTGAEFVAVGYDFEPDALKGIQAGYGSVTLGQNPYLQGYLPVLAFARYFKEGTPLPQGWVDVGTEVADASNVEEIMARENSPEKTAEFYKDVIREKYQDMNSITRPFPGTEPNM